MLRAQNSTEPVFIQVGRLCDNFQYLLCCQYYCEQPPVYPGIDTFTLIDPVGDRYYFKFTGIVTNSNEYHFESDELTEPVLYKRYGERNIGLIVVDINPGKTQRAR